MIESIELICNNSNYIKMMSNLDKYIYPSIANKYNSNKLTVKSNIAKATNNMYKTNSNNTIKIKITPKTIIYYVVEKIKYE